jgi:ribose-phosphate pyrophosphokinase
LRLVQRHRFPDGELKLTLPTPLQGTVLLYRSLHQPNEKLVELLISAPAARALGAERLLLVCPIWPTCARTSPSTRARR